MPVQAGLSTKKTDSGSTRFHCIRRTVDLLRSIQVQFLPGKLPIELRILRAGFACLACGIAFATMILTFRFVQVVQAGFLMTLRMTSRIMLRISLSMKSCEKSTRTSRTDSESLDGSGR